MVNYGVCVSSVVRGNYQSVAKVVVAEAELAVAEAESTNMFEIEANRLISIGGTRSHQKDRHEIETLRFWGRTKLFKLSC